MQCIILGVHCMPLGIAEIFFTFLYSILLCVLYTVTHVPMQSLGQLWISKYCLILMFPVKSHPREISKRFGSLASCFARKHIQVQYSITSSQSTHKFYIKSFTSSSITSTTTTFIHEVQRHQPSTKTPTKEQNGDE